MGELDDPEAWRDALSERARPHRRAPRPLPGAVRGQRGAARRPRVLRRRRRRGARLRRSASARDARARGASSSPSRWSPRRSASTRALEAAGVEVVETDLGEFIVQLTGERPVPHRRAGAAQDARADPRAVLAGGRRGAAGRRRRAGGLRARGACARSSSPPTWASPAATSASPAPARSCSSPTRATGACRRRCRARTSSVMGIERLVPDWESLDCALTLLPRAGTAQRITTYVIGHHRAAARRRRRRPGGAARGARRQRPLADPRHQVRAGAEVHPLRRLPRRLPGVRRRSAVTPTTRVYSGPIGAVLTPLLDGPRRARRAARTPRASAAPASTPARRGCR